MTGNRTIWLSLALLGGLLALLVRSPAARGELSWSIRSMIHPPDRAARWEQD